MKIKMKSLNIGKIKGKYKAKEKTKKHSIHSKMRTAIATLLTLMFVLNIALTNVSIAANSQTAKNITNAKDKVKKNTKKDKVQILVKYKDISKKETVKQQARASTNEASFESVENFKLSKIEVLEVENETELNSIVNKLRQNPEVEFAQPNYKLYSIATKIPSNTTQAAITTKNSSQLPFALVNDPRYLEQWNLNSLADLDTAPIDINAPQAWAINNGDSTVLVGVLDTGIDINHEDIKSNIYKNLNEIAGNGIDDDGNGFIDDINGWDFYNEDNSVFDNANSDTHGTHVAGIIAGSQNTVGISGVAPKVKILPLKFISNGEGYTSDAIMAIEYAKQMGVKIINCSFGGTESNPALKEAMENSNILFVCAAGNDGKDLSANPVYPASFNIPNKITVSATDNTGRLASFSNYGTGSEIAAPGKDILSTIPNNGYAYMSGTSMAAPHVTGVAALIKSHISDIQNLDIISRIKQSVRKSSNLTSKIATGGLLDAQAAMVTTIEDNDGNGDSNDNTDDTDEDSNSEEEDNKDTEFDGILKTLAAIEVSPILMEQLHYGEVGVNIATGNFSKSFNDISMDAPGFKVNISRTYNSKDERTTSTMGRGWTFGFEGSLKQDTTNTSLYIAKLPNGSAQVFVKNGETYTANDSRSTLVKQADNTHILTTKDQYTYCFDTNGYLIWMKDKNANIVSIQVDAQGKVQKISDQTGRQFTVQYNTDNRIQKVIDPMGRIVQYTYENNLLTTVTDPMGYQQQYTYDTSGYLTGIKDKNNVTQETITYNHAAGANQHKVTTYLDVLGVTQTFTYDATNRKTTITYNGRSLEKWYDTQLYTTKSKDPEGKETLVTYYLDTNSINKYGEEHIITDRNGNKTEYGRDNNGNITKTINPDGTEKTYTYDDKNNLTKEVDESGKTTEYIYDIQKVNLLKIIKPLDGTTIYSEETDQSKFAITTYEYYTTEELSLQGINANKLLKSETNPEGNTTKYIYDKYGNKKTVIDPVENATLIERNILGWVIKSTSPQGNSTTFTYDLNGNLIKTTEQGGETTRTLYDKMGRKIQEISPNEYEEAKDSISTNSYADTAAGTRYTYYNSGLLQKTTDAEGNITEYTYDSYGNLQTKKRPNQSVLLYEYDIMNRLTKESFKNDNEAGTVPVVLTEYTYEILEDKTTKETTSVYTNSIDKATTTYIYDYAKRLTSKQYPNETAEKIEYNKNGTIKATIDVNDSKTFMAYDGLNRLVEKWIPAKKAQTINGRYNPILYQYYSYSYDKANRLIAEKNGKDLVELHQTPVADRLVSVNYEYYANGQQKTITNSAGSRTEYTYDKDGNLKQQKAYTTANEYLLKEYTYNHKGNVTQEKQYVRAGDIYPYSMDTDTKVALATTYAYDKNGNITKRTTAEGLTTTYTYDKLNRNIQTKEPSTDENTMPVNLVTSNTYDEMSNLKTITGIDGQITTYSYDKRGNIVKTELTYKENDQTKTEVRSASSYDLAGRKLIQINAKDYTTTAELTQMNRVEYIYDIMGQLVLSQHVYKETPESTEWKTVVSAAYAYDNRGQVTKTLDAEGYAAGIGATPQEKISTGYGITNTYDLMGHTLTELDAVSKERGLNHSIKYSYDGIGRKVSETDVEGATINYIYDDASRLIETTIQSNENVAAQTLHTNTYNIGGLLISQTDAIGNTTTNTYNSLGQLQKSTLPADESIPSNTIWYQYDTMGRLKKQQDSEGTQIINTYNKQGRLTSTTQQGVGGEHPITLKTSYDINGNPVRKTDGEGNTTNTAYDYLKRVKTESITVKDIEGNTTIHTNSYTYDLNNNALSTTDWRQNTLTNVYDALDRLIEKKDSYGNTIEKLEYDLSNRQIKSIDGKLGIKQFTYDKNNRVIATIDQLGNIVRQAYDNRGSIKTKTDENGSVIKYEYNAKKQLIKVINALNETTSYIYDLSGNLLTQTDGNGNTINMSYNCRNMLLERISPNGQSSGNLPIEGQIITADMINDEVLNSDDLSTQPLTQSSIDLAPFTEKYLYNADGTLKEKQDRKGVKTSYTYDAHKRLINQIAGNEKILFTYDNNGNQLAVATENDVTNRTYDELGRVLTKNVSELGTTTFIYDITEGASEGEVKEKTIDPKGNETIKTYDKMGRLTKIEAFEIQEGINTSIGITAYEYDQNGNRSKVIYPDGSKEQYTYYANNKLQMLENYKNDNSSDILLDRYSYQYDKAGNMILKTEMINSIIKGDTTYTYDKLKRIKEVIEPTGKTTLYQYDKAGNRLLELKRQGGQTDTTWYNYDGQNRLTKTLKKTATESVTTKYNYDNNGNLLTQQQEIVKNATKATKPHFGVIIIEDEQEELNQQQSHNYFSSSFYTYNAYNQMVRATSNGKTASYAYNGEGYRIQKNSDGKTTRYLYEYDKVVLETDENRIQTARNVYGINLVSRTITEGAQNDTVYYMYNGHADVTALLDATTGDIKATYYYDAFGTIVEETNGILPEGEKIDNPFRYSGYQYDEETELYYLNARMYDSKIARFLQEDTYRGKANDPLSLNLYTYCSNNPLIYWDYTGHWQSGDETLPEKARIAISQLTDLYIAAKTPEEKKIIHQKAKDIRKANVSATKPQNSPTGTKVNKILSTTKNVDINGNAYLTANEWKAISTTQNDAIVKETNNTLSTLRKATSSGMSQSDYTSELSKALNNISEGIKKETPQPENKKGTDQVQGTEETITRLQNTNFIEITDDNITYYGGDQDWFKRYSQTFGGCGPTAAANILAYMAMSNSELSKLYNYDINNITKEDFAKFMEEVYKYVTPSEIPILNNLSDKKGKAVGSPSFGISNLSYFAKAVEEFAESKGIKLKAHWSNVKPTFENMVSYIRDGLKKDSPTALLNVFNPVEMDWTNPVKNVTKTVIYEQHWVTITGMVENHNTGQVTLEVSSWGGRATLSFNDLYNNMDWNETFFPVGIMYFESVK